VHRRWSASWGNSGTAARTIEWCVIIPEINLVLSLMQYAWVGGAAAPLARLATHDAAGGYNPRPWENDI